jgi:type I restriction enzyme S subunit
MCEVLSGGTPKTSVPEYWDGEVPWASVKDFNINSRWFSSTEKKISREGLDSCSSVLLEPGELVISARGTVGVIAQPTMQTAFNQSNYGLRAKQGLADNDYLYYALVHANKALLGDTHGGMFDTITRSTLDRLLVPNPPLKEQRRIAEALGVFDEKIALNKELSKTLENLAQSIFKSWFIDFEPVRAKMSGEKPGGIDDETASLFPDSMEESDLGLIPRGWTVMYLSEICFTTIGGLWGSDLETPNSPESYFCLRGVDMDDLKESGYASRAPLRWDKKSNYEKRLLTASQVLVAASGAGPVGKSLLWDESLNEIFEKPVIFSNFVKRLECNSNETASFVSATLQMMYRSREIFTFVNGTSVPNLQDTELLNSKRIALPPKSLLLAFDEYNRNVLKHKYSGENRTLKEIRDSLLPRLISGELQIPEEMLAL